MYIIKERQEVNLHFIYNNEYVWSGASGESNILL